MAKDFAPAETEEGALLAGLRGEVPPAPDWFLKAVAVPYETRRIAVNGAEISYQLWGKPGAPGILFVHGNAAHGHWWDFIAPFFAGQFSVASITLSGMGASSWRKAYDMKTFSAELIAVCEHAGFFEAKQKPVIFGHSFGGFVSAFTAADAGERFSGIAVIDSPILPPGELHGGPSGAGRPHRIYPTLAAALARFRLAPPQICEALYAVDYIARWSLRKTEGGVTWKFDPALWMEFKPEGAAHEFVAARRCPMAFVRGEQSVLVTDRIWKHTASVAGAGSPMISVPDAQHHLLLDQPLATITALRGVLAAWNYRG